jgi:Tol biopolymer transport system component
MTANATKPMQSGRHAGRNAGRWRGVTVAVATAIGSLALGAAVPGAGAAPAASAAPAAPAATSELVSVATTGAQGNDMSGRYAGPAISGDGRFVAFDSQANTLVDDDENRQVDMFVHDRVRNTTRLISRGFDHTQARAGTSTRPAIDFDGGTVAYDSSATNLVPGDTNHALDVFVWDRRTNTTSRASVTPDGHQANGFSDTPSLSADGRYVSFVSIASNLVPGDTNNVEDIFVRDLVTGATERVSVASDGTQGNSSTTQASISPDGRWVAFSSFASNLVRGDTNDTFDVFIHDRETGRTDIVSVSSTGAAGDAISSGPTVSNDGRFVAFSSDATTLVPDDTNGRKDVFVHDRITRTTVRASVNSNGEQADGTSPEAGVRGFVASTPDVTADGRYVAFFSSATNLVPGDTNSCPLFFEDPGRCPDVFVRDLVAGTTTRVNVAADGAQANDRSSDPSISENGAVAYWSAANNLVDADSNTCPLFTSFPGNCPDIVVHTG